MKIHYTNSEDEIKSVIYSFYNDLVYDDSPSLEDLVVDNSVWLILLDDQEAVAGVITFEYINNVLWMPHVFIYEQYRGKNSDQWGKLAVEFMRKNFNAQKFLALTPYLSALRYAERVGFKCIATLSKSVKKNGVLLDQYVLEM